MTMVWFGAAILLMALYAFISEYRRRRRIWANIKSRFGARTSGIPEMLYVKSFWEAYLKNTTLENAIDDITWNDLDMDSVYLNINHCQSGAGDLWLYSQLHANQRDRTAFFDAKAKELFETSPKLLLKIQYDLALLGHKGGTGIETVLYYIHSLQFAHPGVYVFLAVLPGIFFLSGFAAGAQFGVLMGTAAFLFNYAAAFYLRNKPGSGFLSIYAFSSLLFCAKRILKKLEKSKIRVCPEYESAVKSFDALKLPISLIHFSDSMFSMGIPDPFSFFLLPILCHAYILHKLKAQPDNTFYLLAFLGEMDLSIGVLSLRKAVPWYCRPVYTENKTLSFEKLYHPLLENPVSNSARFDADILFTGSNASGKSTFIKTVAVNCITGAVLDTCFAESFCMRRGAVLSSMAIQDSLLAGTSYFVAELQSIKRIIDQLQSETFCYVFIDEILRGTNTLERVSAAASVLEYLHAQNALVMAATHDLELTKILAPYYQNYHFEEQVTDHAVRFDYKLRRGPSHSRNALLLMETMHYPDAILASSRRLVQAHEDTGAWDLCKPS